MKKRVLWVVLLLTAAAWAQTDVQPLIDEAMKPSKLEENLRFLTDEIGGRVPGEPAMEGAVFWGVNSFRTAGADKVDSEEFVIPVGWEDRDTSLMVGVDYNAEGRPRDVVYLFNWFRARVVALPWTASTQGTTTDVLEARVVDVGDGSEQGFANAGNINGAVILVHSEEMKTWDDLFAEYLRMRPLLDRAEKGGAVGIAFMSSRPHDLLYRHIPNLNDKIEKLPMVMVAREDAERIARLVARHKKVVAALRAPNKITGAITTANVVAEIRGTEKPDEFVLIGAHLDSWDLGTGALDDGCNDALLVDVVRAIKASGMKPKRSIRFVMFSGEEQGTLGSLAYVRAHKAELDKMVMGIFFDEGTGRVTGFSTGGRPDVVAALTPMLKPFEGWKATTLTNDAFVGTDNYDFLIEGVPTLVANQEEANYLINYHASSDTYDKVDFKELKKNVSIATALAFQIANAPERVGKRQSRAEIEQLLKDTKLDGQMKLFGLWDEWAAGTRGRK